MAGERPSFKVKHVLVCDDVRQEINGKDILIGVYTNWITVPSLPTNLVLSFWLHYSFVGIGEVPLEFRLLGPHDVQFMSAGVTMSFLEENAETRQTASFTLGGVPEPIQIPGELRLQLKQYNEEWQTIGSVNVRQSNNAGTATSKPL